jgi:hypothetical protein
MVYSLYIVDNGYVLWNDIPLLVRNVGHILVLSVKHTYIMWGVGGEGGGIQF